MRTLFYLSLASSAGILGALHHAAAQTERPRAPEVESITAADLRADLFFLASVVGQPGVTVPGVQGSRPPGAFGGNLDVKDLKAGTTVYLPVFQPGALFYAGDPPRATARSAAPRSSSP